MKMNKNKLIIMGLTFLVLIAITPLIFGKLMNKQYNKMLDGLRQKGISVKIVKDNSTYLQTDKVLEIEIPSKFLADTQAVKNIRFRIETKFKNLPVTSVYFIGKVEHISFLDKYKTAEVKINDFVSKYVKFVITTPNFRDYSYKFDDIIVKGSPEIGFVNIKGDLKYSDFIKNVFTVKNIYIKDKTGIVEFNNFKNSFEGNNKNALSKTDFDVNVDLKGIKAKIDNIYSVTKTILADKASVNVVLGFKKLNVTNMVDSEKFVLKGKINNIDNLTQKLAAASSDEEQNLYLEKIFEKGFNIGINSSLKDIQAMGRDFGGYNLSFNVKFLPTKNFRQKLREDKIDFVDAELNLTTTPEMAEILMSFVPKSAFVLALAKKENGKVTLNLEFKKGKLYSEGQLIK
jgi:hypothetical protein